MIHRWCLIACGSVLALAASTAGAKAERVVTIREIVIVGRIQKPIAAVDVSRIQPKLSLTELHEDFLSRISAVISRDPL